jgi:hypothetical protein
MYDFTCLQADPGLSKHVLSGEEDDEQTPCFAVGLDRLAALVFRFERTDPGRDERRQVAYAWFWAV